MILYEWVSAGGVGGLTKWKTKLEPEDRARVNAKIDDLRDAGQGDLPNLVFCPVKDYKKKTWRQICKIRVRGETVQLRPLLCKGPMPGERDVLTFLCGAKDWTILPPKAPKTADGRRKRLIDGQDGRKRL